MLDKKAIIKNKNGITMMALIIAVLILLILAGVVVAALSGDEGILRKTIRARDSFNASAIEEQVQLQVSKSYNKKGDIDKDLLKENLKKNLGIDPEEIEEEEDGKWSFPVGDIEVTVDPNIGTPEPEDKTQDRPITVYFDYYSWETKDEIQEEKQVTILAGDSDATVDQPKSIDTKMMINGREVTATLRGWSKSIDGSSGIAANYGKKMTVTKRDDEKTFYMIYSFKVKASVTDEYGKLREKEYEIEVGPDGNKADTGDNENPFHFPENPKVPDKWKGPTTSPEEFDEDLKFEGWVKKDSESTEGGYDSYEDVENPDKEIPNPGDRYYPKFSKNIRIQRYINPNNTKMEDIIERIYAIREEIYPITIDLGKGTEFELNRKQATPERWVTNLDNPEEGRTINIEDGTTVELEESTDFYMIYKVKAVIKVQDENGTLQEMEMFSHIDCNGNPQKGPNGEENDKIKLPDNPKIPDMWKEKNEEDVEFKGWSKKNTYDEETEYKDVDIETDVPEQGDEYYFRYELTIHVNRYIYKDGQPNQKMDELQGIVVAIGEDINKKAEVPLGTTDEVVFDGRTAAPDRWVTDLDNEDPEKSVKVNENASLEDDEDYYIMYLIKLIVSMPDETGNMQQNEIQEEIGADGNPHAQDVDRTLKLPDTPKPPEGWGKDDDANPNPNTSEGKYGEGVEFEGWVKKNATIIPDGGYKDVDPETEKPQAGDEYYPKFKRTIVITFDVNSGERGNIPETLTSEMKAIGQEVTQKALITIPEEQPTKEGYTYLGWYDSKETIEGSSKYESGQQYDTFRYSMTLYAMWKDSTKPIVEITPIGKEEWKQEHTTNVTVEDNEDVKELTLKYLWNQDAETELNEESFDTAENFVAKTPNEQSQIVETIKTPKKSGNNWYLWIFAKDKAENTQIIHSNAFWIDNTAPAEISKIDITNTTTNSVEVEAQATTDTDSGIDKYLFSIDTAPEEWKEVSADGLKGNPTYTFTGLTQNQNYTVTVKAVDKVGLESDTVSTDGDRGTSKVPGGSEDPSQSAIKFEMHEIEESGSPKTEIWTGSQWTNKKVQLLVKYDLLNGQDFDVEYSTKSSPKPESSEDWQSYDKVNGITLDANAVIYARLKEQVEPGQKAQYGDYATTNILMIDRVAPNAFNKLPQITNTTTNTVTIQGTTTDELSQIKEYKYSCEEKSTEDVSTLSWENQVPSEDIGTHTFKKLTQGETYYFRIKAIDKAGNETISEETSQQVENIPDPSLEKSAITFDYNEVSAEGKAWDKNWTKNDVTVTAKLSDEYKGTYTIETTQTPEQEATWQKTDSVTLNKNGTVYARIVDSEEQHSAGNASTNVSKIDKHAPTGLAIDDVSTTTNSVQIDAHEATDPKEGGASDLEPSSGVEGYYFRLDETGEWLTNADDHKKRTYTFVNGQDGTATIATISNDPMMIDGPSFDGMEVEQGSTHTVYVKVKDNAGNETDDDAVKQENIIVKTIPGTGSNEQNITFEMTTKATGEEVPWHDTDTEWTKGPVTVKVNNSTTADYGKLKLEYIYQKTGQTTTEAPADGWQVYNTATGITNIVTNGTIWVRLKEEVPEGKPSQAGEPIKLELKHIDSVQPDEFKVVPTITDENTNSFIVQGTTTDSISSIKEYKYSYTTNAEAQESTLTWENQTESEAAGTHTFKNLVQGTTYYVRIKAIDQAGNERVSNPATIQTTQIPQKNAITITMSVNDKPWDGTQWTKESVKVEITYTSNIKNQNFKIQYSTKDTPNIDSAEDWQDYPADGIIVAENKSVHARLKEEVGNQHSANYKTQIIDKIDKTSPVISMLNVETETSIDGGVKITANLEDVESGLAGYQISKESNLEETSSNDWKQIEEDQLYKTKITELITTEGKWFLYVKDQVGHISKEEIEVKGEYFNNITPIISFNPEWQTSKEIIITYPEIKGLIKEYKTSDSQTFTQVEENTVKFTIDKRMTITAKATLGTEGASKIETAEVTTIDLEAPSAPKINITEGTAGNNDWYRSDVKLSIDEGQDESDGSGVKKTTYVITGAQVQDETEGTELTIESEGTSYITAYTYDGVDHKTASETLTINKDSIAPEIKLTPENEDKKEYSKTVNVEIKEDTSKLETKKFANRTRDENYFKSQGETFEEDSFIAISEEADISNNKVPEKIYSVYAQDKAGNISIKTIELKNLLINIVLTGKKGRLNVTATGKIDETTGAISGAGSRQFGPYWALPGGTYEITYTGSNLPTDLSKYDCAINIPSRVYEITPRCISPDKVSYTVKIDDDTGSGIEVRQYLNSDTVIDNIRIRQIGTTYSVGETVVYEANGISDWEVLYEDTNDIYIITSDYIPNNLIPSETEVAKTGETQAYWSTTPQSAASLSDAVKSLKNKFYFSQFTNTSSTNNNAICAATLLNTDYWKKFVNNDYISNGASIGSPTLELWLNAWKKKGYKQIYSAFKNNNGYSIGWTEGAESSNLDDIKTECEEGYNDTLFYPHQNTNAGAQGYWLAAPSYEQANYMMAIYDEGSLHAYNSDSQSFACRPVVRIPKLYNNISYNSENQLIIEPNAYEITDNVLAYYDAKNNTGNRQHNSTTTTWKDLTSNANDITLKNTNNTATSGWTSDGLILDGEDDYGVINKLNISNYDDLSISATYKTISKNGRGALICSATPGSGRLFMGWNPGHCINFTMPDTWMASSSALEEDKIFHFTATFKGKNDNSQNTLYKNGVNIIKNNTPMTSSWSSNPLEIGRSWGGSDPTYSLANVQIYDLIIYKGTLSENEIQQNYKLAKEKYNLK